MTDRDRAVLMLGPDRADDIVDVLADAFYDYPVMRFVLGDEPEYTARLHTLIGFFVAARVLRGEPLLGVGDDEGLTAAAIVTLPGGQRSPNTLGERRETTWRQLGPEPRSRYERLGEVWSGMGVDRPCHHLNMIGVRRGKSSLGLGRALLDAVHTLADADPESAGVSLTTEDPANVGWYQYCGYDVVDHQRVDDVLETWAFFRPSPTAR